MINNRDIYLDILVLAGGAVQGVRGDLPQDGADPVAQHEAGAQPLHQRGACMCPTPEQGQM